MSAARVAVVTGASGGIGREIAGGLVRQGMHVLLACRSPERGRAAASALAREGPGTAELVLVDFSRPRSIEDFAATLRIRYPAIHVLVNNAGVWSARRRETADGIELTWATNVLGYFLATERLMGALCAGAPARIVNVASGLAYGLDLEDVEFRKRTYDGVAAYAQSKHADRMLAWAWARRLGSAGVTANAMHPGMVNTGIFAKGGGLKGYAASLYTLARGRSAAQGADTAVWLATSPELAGVTGRFFKDRREANCPFRGEEMEERLLAVCARMTGLG